MMEGLYQAVRANEKQSIWRALAILLAATISFAAVLGLIYLDLLGVSAAEHLPVIGIFALGGALLGLVLLVLLRALIQRGLINGLDRLDAVTGAGGQQTRKMAWQLEFEALEQRLIWTLDERRNNFLDREERRLLATSRYGWSMPPEQLERILDDETAAFLRGKSRDCVQVFLSTQGLARTLLADPDKSEGQFQALVKKHLSRVQAFARSSGMLLAHFSLDFSVLLADVPSPGKQSLHKRLPTLAKKWLGQCENLLEEAQATGVDATCLVTFGKASWGRIQSGSRIAFHVLPSVWQPAVACLREQRAKGLWLSAAFCEHAALVGDESLVERVPGAWFSLD